MASQEITWDAPNFKHHAKDSSWYWMSMVVTLIFLGAAVWQRNFLFGFFIIVAEILVIVWAERKPGNFTFKLTEHALEIVGYKEFTLADFVSFSVAEEKGEWSRISLRSKHTFKSPLMAFVPSSKIEEIKKFLGAFVEEHEYEHTFFETLENFLRF